jgi:hypothetical protein
MTSGMFYSSEEITELLKRDDSKGSEDTAQKYILAQNNILQTKYQDAIIKIGALEKTVKEHTDEISQLSISRTNLMGLCKNLGESSNVFENLTTTNSEYHMEVINVYTLTNLSTIFACFICSALINTPVVRMCWMICSIVMINMYGHVRLMRSSPTIQSILTASKRCGDRTVI